MDVSLHTTPHYTKSWITSKEAKKGGKRWSQGTTRKCFFFYKCLLLTQTHHHTMHLLKRQWKKKHPNAVIVSVWFDWFVLMHCLFKTSLKALNSSHLPGPLDLVTSKAMPFPVSVASVAMVTAHLGCGEKRGKWSDHRVAVICFTAGGKIKQHKPRKNGRIEKKKWLQTWIMQEQRCGLTSICPAFYFTLNCFKHYCQRRSSWLVVSGWL